VLKNVNYSSRTELTWSSVVHYNCKTKSAIVKNVKSTKLIGKHLKCVKTKKTFLVTLLKDNLKLPFKKHGQLNLILNHVTTIQPKKLTFDQPTI